MRSRSCTPNSRKKKGASEFFYREAKALLAVRHPAVVHCHDLLSDDAGRVYLIMEMIEGIPLSKKIDEGPLSPDDVAILGARVSQGLSAAHHKGVIHRDVSPDNIVLPNGRVQEAKIIDFGIAKLLEDGEGTIVEGFKGKLSYASPEQLGFFGGKIDGQSDFYSLGLVLVAAAQGRPMGMGTTVVEAVDARRSFETLPDEIPVGLRSAIQPLLALDPDDRPRYVDRLFVVPGAGEGRKGTGPIPDDAIARSRGTKAKSGNRIGPIAGGAVAAALLVGGGLYLGWSGTGTTEAKAPTVVVDSATTGAEPGALDLETPGREQGGLEEDLPTVDETGLDTSAPMPERPTPRRLSAGDRIKIIGLINNAKLALEENRLMSPANDNAYDRYRRVLTLDPNEERAKNGLREVASRYVRLAGQALDKGDLEGARTFVDRAKRADATQPGIASLESRIDH
ncbi:MAG: serine/threonine protein kinase [bacterium]|nr:serine/threonine protein kinase [bacterium]